MKAHKLGPRFIAFLLDMLVLGFLSRVLTSLGLGEEVEYLNGMKVMSLSYVENFLLYIVYFIGFAVFNNGKTLGKIVMRLKITDESYQNISGNQLIFREFLKSLFMPISFISFFIALVRPDKRSLHDLLMNTYVVKESTTTERSDRDMNGYYNYKDERKDRLDSDYYDDSANQDSFDDFDK